MSGWVVCLLFLHFCKSVSLKFLSVCLSVCLALTKNEISFVLFCLWALGLSEKMDKSGASMKDIFLYGFVNFNHLNQDEEETKVGSSFFGTPFGVFSY